ncbi:alpha/beta fold hydrolase [Streptomyces sp. RS10V-4]|uniref:alpha/beta fold hydrolase n=1 Tax=Streptomyces rhizoryzae TaxID=2932493 RepID=UPI002004E3F1|nr:alpha/beta hydrolase [Streptomyces rhizoryzae]MCK7626011.1 alpha/beta fold hydrolase [Streptomyces rhizoryzae]
MTTTSPWTATAWAHNGRIRVAYDQLAADGPAAAPEPLLLVTGLGVSRRWWPTGLARALAAEGFAVARYDQRDAGESTHLPPASRRGPIAALVRRRGDAYSAEDMADDAIAVLDALGWESAHLFGQSLGGAVAQRIALRHPARVRTLTSVSAVPGDAAGPATLRHIRLRTLARLARTRHPQTPEGHIEAGVALARLLRSPGYPFDERTVRDMLSAVPDAGVVDARSQSRQIGAQWHGPPIDRITTPTLVLHGLDDPLVKPSAGRTVAARIPGARFVPLPGVGHDLPEPVWTEVARHVRHLADGSHDEPPAG